MADKAARASVNIVIAHESGTRQSEIVDRLRSAGLSVDLVSGNVVTGSIDSGKVASLSSLEGIKSVEPARRFQLERPDSDIQ